MGIMSGDDLVVGSPNLAQDTTLILAAQRTAFGGDTGMVFVVGTLEQTISIPSITFNPPLAKLHAIVGRGTNFGVGVIGLDSADENYNTSQVKKVGPLEKVGVYGNGDRSGVMGESLRGSGVEGIGGLLQFTTTRSDVARVGVVGRGGRQLLELKKSAQKPAPHGPGVYGISGGLYELTESDLITAGNVGVFGRGAGEHFGENGRDSRSASPGVGVAGQGGISTSGSVAPGVVGISGRGPSPPAPSGGVPIGQDIGDVGVHGFGVTGVQGVGENGIKGVGTEGRGGIFQSDESAQLQLIPRTVPGARNQAPFTPSAIIGAGRLLPESGRPGDLMAIADAKGECTLWFCVSSEVLRSRPQARWAQVLLGPTVVGKA